ncbi:MAG: hypothetical protein ACR2HJ_02180 [Fimbriimonadales bacterium]
MDCATFGRFALGWAALVLLLSGCTPPEDKPFPDHTIGFSEPKPDRGYALYVEAAKAAERDTQKQITRTIWTPGQKDYALRHGQRALGILRSAQSGPVTYSFAPAIPGAVREPVRGWRFLGRVLCWRIEEAETAESLAQATNDFMIAARMGADLAGGDAQSAGLGFEIAREAAKPFWRRISDIPNSELNRVYTGLSAALQTLPAAGVTLRNERETMLRAVQWVQSLYLVGDFDQIRKALGDYVEPTIKFMREMKDEPRAKQVTFFEGLAQEAEQTVKNQMAQVAAGAHRWDEPDQPAGERPWKRLANSLFQGGQAFLEQRAIFETEMRLLALDAALLAASRQEGKAPADLLKFPKWLRTDPYSGRDFVYVPQGGTYKLYGVGPDGKEDGGDSSDITIGR